MSARLPVIGQDCQSCPLKSKCWDTSRNPRDEVLVINLLVCRLKLGIKREATTRLLLQLLQPKVNSIAAFIQRSCDCDDFEVVKLEVQSAVIEALLTDYKLGERAWPLHYLFARPRGVITGWTLRYIERRRRSKRFVSVGMTPDVDVEWTLNELNASVTQGRIQEAPVSYEETEETEELLTPFTAALAHVEDGVTLSAREYRVMRFCLNHSGDSRPGENGTPVSGLHIHLSERMGWDRSKVSRVYRQASAKVIEVVGHTERVLGLGPLPVAPQARRSRVLGLGREALSDEEAEALVAFADREGDTAACRAFGVHSKTIYLRRRNHEST